MVGILPSFRPHNVEDRYRSVRIPGMSQEQSQRQSDNSSMADSQARFDLPFLVTAHNDAAARQGLSEAANKENSDNKAPSAYKKDQSSVEVASVSSSSAASSSKQDQRIWQKLKPSKSEEERLAKEQKKKQRKEDYERLNMSNRVAFGEGQGSYRLQ